MNYLLAAIGLIAMFLSLSKKQWIAALISIGFTVSPLLLLLDAKGLFYHSLGLTICSTISLLVLILLSRPLESKKSVMASLLIVIPYLTICVFKLFLWQGITIIKWSLILGLISFLYITFERKLFDFKWFMFLFISISSLLILSS